MIKKLTLNEVELIEFFVLGFVLGSFLVVFPGMKVNNFISALTEDLVIRRNDVSGKCMSKLPNITIVDNMKTPNIPNDDIVSYSTNYFSILFPYNLSFYTAKFGVVRSSERLKLSLNQMYNQTVQSNVVQNSIYQKGFKETLDLWTDVILIQSDIYEMISINKHGISDDVKKIHPVIGEKIILLQRRSDEINYILNTSNITISREFLIIFNSINDHMFILNQKAYLDYCIYTNTNKEYVLSYRQLKKSNIIDTIENRIFNQSGF